MRVAVLMGGPSSEHEVSLQGGMNVASALDPVRFDARPVVITREGAWRLAPRKRRAGRFSACGVVSQAARSAGAIGGGLDPASMDHARMEEPGVSHAKALDAHATEDWSSFPGACEGIVELKAWGADIVFPVLHGAFGEDGTVQAMLQAAGLDFVGSGHRGSAVAFDKVRTKEVLAFHGIRTPEFEVVEAKDFPARRAEAIERWIERLGLPLVLKDPLGGSSLEVHIAGDEGEVAAALDALLPKAERILIEAFVAGVELTAGVIEDFLTGEPRALPIVEIRPQDGATFDYFQKYNADGAEEIVPAEISEELTWAAQGLGLLVHRLLGLRGLSRTDLRMDTDGNLFVLEVNTLPGMTSRGLLPLAAAHEGLDFPALISGLVRTAGVRA